MHFPTMLLLSISDPIALRLRLRVANPITIRMYACCTAAKHMLWFWSVSFRGTVYHLSPLA